jgi:tetratricopeptide (TPR) repeat protein
VLLPVADAKTDQTKDLDRQFRTALAEYEAGHFPEAARQLELLVRAVPSSFDVNELLGMVYAAESEDLKANQHLAEAVRLNPKSAAAHTNLATNLVHMGKAASAEPEFKQAVAIDPKGYDTNHNLGEFYAGSGKISDAIPYLAKAQQIHPAAYDNGYDLSLAYLETGRLGEARNLVHALLQQKNTAELHNLLAQVEEKASNYLAAVNEYETAAHMDSSESNLFDWGSELLLHRTLDSAIEVFQTATERYPNSPRLAVGLGMSLYSRGNYDDAVKALLRAADLNPSDPRCYYFLSKAYDSSPSQAAEVIQHFRRFAELQPADPQAPYYYAMSIWKGRRTEAGDLDLRQIESLLKRAVALDPNYADAHLQLGNLYSDQRQYSQAIPEYERALQVNSNLADAHYRLGQAYVHTGQKELAQKELKIYQQVRAEHMAELDKQRAEIRQFVVSERQGTKQ